MPPRQGSQDDELRASTVPAALIAGVLASAIDQGFDGPTLTRAAALSEAELADPTVRLPLSRYCDLWDAIARDPRGDAFAVSLGTHVRIAALGVVGYVMQHAATVREAYASFSRFSRLVNDRIAPEIEERADAIVFRRRLPERVVRNRPMCVAGPLTTVPIVRDLAGLAPEQPVAVGVELPCAAPGDPRDIERAYGCRVRFGGEEAVLRLRREVFDLPVRQHDPALFHYLSRHAEELVRLVPDSQRLSDRVRAHLLARLDEGAPSAAEVARALATSERSLHRRLAEEGTTFGAILEESRASLAKRYLADPHLAIDEIAFLLGYSEASTFQRAFRRWTGVAPGAFRRSLAGSEPRSPT